MCLEDHRLMIDQAIDKLKGELSQKDKDIIEPLVYRQKLMTEQQNQHNSKLEQKIQNLETMVRT